MSKQTLCWKCKNRDCEWMREFKEVPGWKAAPTKIKNNYIDNSTKIIDSFLILNFGQFKQPKKIIQAERAFEIFKLKASNKFIKALGIRNKKGDLK